MTDSCMSARLGACVENASIVDAWKDKNINGFDAE